ncbi:MAG: HNH endonuclease [Gemmatimonadota bacterium]|nr:HNH endonuclease [Gemmatimonadota bacterium]
MANGFPKNPPWARDELILALDLYFKHNPSHVSKSHHAIISLSQLLNSLPIHKGPPDSRKFRNPNGVYMKLCNFLRFDPEYKGVGLKKGSKLERHIWDEFCNDRERLRKIAVAITEMSKIERNSKGGVVPDVDDDEGVSEGKLLMQNHKIRERNPKIIKRKKDSVLKMNGRFRCEVCQFDFEETYGIRGQGFIECHHKKPLADLKRSEKIKLSDLALVCSNCHRMLHRGETVISIEELVSIIKSPPLTTVFK